MQLALNEVEAGSDRWQLIGLQADVGNFGGFSITALAGGRFGMHIDEQPVEHTQLPVDVDATLDCFRSGLILTEHDDVPVGILVFTQQHGPQPDLIVEIVGAADGVASELLGSIKRLMRDTGSERLTDRALGITDDLLGATARLVQGPHRTVHERRVLHDARRGVLGEPRDGDYIRNYADELRQS